MSVDMGASIWQRRGGTARDPSGRVAAPEEASRKLRLFFDSNALTGGIVTPWGIDEAVLSLCAARVCRLVLAEAVREEVEDNLLVQARDLPPKQADEWIEDDRRLIELRNRS